MAELQRITEVYGGMYDDELINLVAEQKDLTEIARQVLELELRKRGLGDLSHVAVAREIPEPKLERRAALMGNQGGAPQIVLDYRATQMGEAPLEYSWKTLLCECESAEKAQVLCEALRQAGIDNWIDGQPIGFRNKDVEFPNPRIMVAADQLEQARAIAADPTAQGIVEDSKFVEPAFDMPKCPHCGAGDPALEGVNPFNSWRCDGCGYQWTESDPTSATNGDK